VDQRGGRHRPWGQRRGQATAARPGTAKAPPWACLRRWSRRPPEELARLTALPAVERDAAVVAAYGCRLQGAGMNETEDRRLLMQQWPEPAVGVEVFVSAVRAPARVLPADEGVGKAASRVTVGPTEPDRAVAFTDGRAAAGAAGPATEATATTGLAVPGAPAKRDLADARRDTRAGQSQSGTHGGRRAGGEAGRQRRCRSPGRRGSPSRARAPRPAAVPVSDQAAPVAPSQTEATPPSPWSPPASRSSRTTAAVRRAVRTPPPTTTLAYLHWSGGGVQSQPEGAESARGRYALPIRNVATCGPARPGGI